MADSTLHEELYRSKEAMKRLQTFKVLVCGAGALGSNILESLARQGFTKLCVVDFDRVEDRNLSTQPYGRQNIGQKKTSAIVNKIYRDLEIDILWQAVHMDAGNAGKFIKGWDLIVDAFDNAPSRNIVAIRAKQENIPCLHVGIAEDGNYSEGVWNQVYSIPGEIEDSEICNYPLARNLVSITVGLACELIVQFATTGVQNTFTFTFKDLTINR